MNINNIWYIFMNIDKKCMIVKNSPIGLTDQPTKKPHVMQVLYKWITFYPGVNIKV